MLALLAMEATPVMFMVLLSAVHHVHGNEQLQKVLTTANSGCELFEGSWVRDESNPVYETSNCPFLEKEFGCLKNGRPDTDYLKYRWQPAAANCSLPRFNGGDFLSKLEGKSIMFVGDSLSLNQWQSLTCMLHVAVPNASYTSVRTGGLSTFTFPEYKAKLMFSRNAFLVDIVNTSTGIVLKLDSIEASKLWNGVDVMIFDSWHWWLHTGRKQPWNFIQEGNSRYKDMDRLVAYEKALNTWANWVDANVDPSKTSVFFQGVSPDHNNGSDWGEDTARFCKGQKQPFQGSEYPAGPHRAEQVVERVLGAMQKPVYLLNITALSQLRIDGHPSVYGSGGHMGMDCSHWCLPGVPDTWNQFLYALLLQIYG